MPGRPDKPASGQIADPVRGKGPERASRMRTAIPSSRTPDLDEIFHALGDPTRRAMVETLSRGPLSVSALAAPFAITLAAVVQHLQILEGSGLVRTEKTGRVRTCRIEPRGLASAQAWINDRRSTWERRLDRLGDLLDEEETDSPAKPDRG